MHILSFYLKIARYKAYFKPISLSVHIALLGGRADSTKHVSISFCSFGLAPNALKLSSNPYSKSSISVLFCNANWNKTPYYKAYEPLNAPGAKEKAFLQFRSVLWTALQLFLARRYESWLFNLPYYLFCWRDKVMGFFKSAFPTSSIVGGPFVLTNYRFLCDSIQTNKTSSSLQG